MAKLNNILIIVGILVILLLMITLFPVNVNQQSTNEINKFSSLQELQNYLSEHQSSYGGGILEEALGAPSLAKADSTSLDTSTRDYSTTNIQVQGVDEPDIVKNDDKYIYITSGEEVIIIDGYPAEQANIIETLDVDGIVHEIFINNDKLIVFGQEQYNYPTPLLEGDARITSSILPPYPYYSQKSFIKIYNIQDKDNIELEENLVYDGSYYDARMINNYIYAIVNQPINYDNDKIVMPELRYNNVTVSVAPTDVYYFDIFDYGYRLTTIFAINLDNLDNLEKQTFLTGYTQTMYVSENNIYLAAQKQVSYKEYENLEEEIIEKAMIPLVDFDTANKIREILNDEGNFYEKQPEIQKLFYDYYNKLDEDEKAELLEDYEDNSNEIRAEFQKELEKTIIHKISIDKDNIEYKAKGEFPGTVLDQFSMDEYKDNFRIATTTGEIFTGTSLNHLYVLDENMEIIGKLEDLAHGERIYSARFMGDRAYLVTFKKIDPFFAIDLSNPEYPEVLGILKIPGYSDYLHPYDETHIIGIGKEAVDAGNENRDFAWYQGIKLSLFDVTDVENPIEVSKFNIGDRGTDSEVLYEHKAFLFDKEKELIVIPISLHEIDESKYPNNVPDNAYGNLVFEGAYVLNLNLEDGFSLLGRITHLDDEDLANLNEQRYYYPPYGSKIRRSLYIDNILYTISQDKVKINDLDNLAEINVIDLPYNPEEPIIYY